MKKTVWVLNHYASKDFYDKGWRHYYIAKYLKKAGYDVAVFGANSLHNSDVDLCFPDIGLWKEQLAEEIDVPFVFIKARAYKGNGKARILNMLDYYINVQKAAMQYAEEHGKPDIIIGSSVHPLTCVAAIKLAKKFKCRQIVEIRDLWPESIVVYGVASKNNPIIKFLYRLERWIYTKADAIVFTMEGGKDYIIEKGWDTANGGKVDLDKVHHINNGVDLELFDYNREHHTFKDADLDDKNSFKVIYTGSVRKVNDIEILLDAAEELKNRGKAEIKLLIFGDGDQREQLEAEAKKRALDNIIFKGRVDKECVPYVLSKADAVLLHWKPTPITKYGMSMNKTFEYFAAGKPVISNSISGYDLIKENGCGIASNITNAKEYADSIEQVESLSNEQYKKFCRNARETAKKYDYRELTKKLIALIEKSA